MTSQGHAYARFQRALKTGNAFLANLSIGTTRPSPALDSSLHQRFRAIGRDTGIFTPAVWIRRVEISSVGQAATYGITIKPLAGDPGR